MSLPSTEALITGYFFSACTAAFTKKRHEAELDAVLLLELVLVLLAHLHHRRHVDFVEGGQDGVGRLRLQQALGDARAQARHRHALLGAVAQVGARPARRPAAAAACAARRRGAAARRRGGWRRRPARRARRPWSRGRRGRCRRRSRSPGLLSAIILAAAGIATSAFEPPAARRGAAGGAAPAPARPPAAARRGAAAPALPSVSILRDHLARRRRCRRRALMISASTPAAGAGTSSTTLSVSMSIRFSSTRDGLAGLLLPLQQGRFGHRLGQLRNFHFNDCHLYSLVLDVCACGRGPRRSRDARAGVGVLLGQDEALELAEGLRRPAPSAAPGAGASSRPPARPRRRGRHSRASGLRRMFSWM